jgi:hypothetical protein
MNGKQRGFFFPVPWVGELSSASKNGTHHAVFSGADGAHAPPVKETGALLRAPIPKLKLRTTCCFFSLVQVRRVAIRRCVCCGIAVANSNLGGHSRKSALGGHLFCYACADAAPEIFLAIVMGGV